MNVFEGHSTVSPLDAGEVERRERAAGPARERDRRQLVPRLPGRLEAGVHLGLGPAVGVEHLVDQRVQAPAVAVIEADREAREVRGGLLEAEDAAVVIVGRRLARVTPAVAGQTASSPRVRSQILPVCVRAGKPVRQGGRYRVFARRSSAMISSSAAAVRRCERCGAVEVGIVQEDHIARRTTPASARGGDPARRRELAPVLAPA